VIEKYAIYSDVDQMVSYFGLETLEELSANYNTYPTQKLPVIKAAGQLDYHYWGLPPGAAKNKSLSKRLFNLEVSDIQNRPVYQKQFKSRRCLIPCNGFFLWKTIGKKKKSAHFFRLPETPLFAIAGIWDDYEDIDGNSSLTFNMIVRDSDENLQEFSDVSPLIIPVNLFEEWLSNEAEYLKILESANSLENPLFVSHFVSPMIKDTNINKKTLVEPIRPTDQFGNYTLFS